MTPGIATSPWPCSPMPPSKSPATAPAHRQRCSGRERGGASREHIPLTLPEVRRLLLLLAEPSGAARAQRLRWSQWRRQHQALARRGHVARRAARQPLPAPADPPAADGARRDRGPDRPSLAAGDAALTAPEAAPWPPGARPPPSARGPALGHAHRRALAGDPARLTAPGTPSTVAIGAGTRTACGPASAPFFIHPLHPPPAMG